MSSFLDKIKSKIFLNNQLSSESKRKKLYHNIKQNENPEEVWTKVAEIGDGSFGKVYKVTGFIPWETTSTDWNFFPEQARNKLTNKYAAAKICEINEDNCLEDFIVEIDILKECRHPNILQFYEAYVFENSLWVRIV